MARVPVEQQGPAAVGKLPKFASRVGLGIVSLMALAPVVPVGINAAEGNELTEGVSYFNPDSYNFDNMDDAVQAAISTGYVAAMLFILYFSVRPFTLRDPNIVRSEPTTVHVRKPSPLS